MAGVAGSNALSRERINEVAQQIATGTGLDVDIVAGSSPEPVTVHVPAGHYGQPALAVTEGWVKKGVAVAILAALDKKSVTLFTLILVVCMLFVANAATAAVRGRRRELGVLASLGWRRSRLFAAVLGELAGIGLAAGLLGAAVALPLSAALGLRASPGRALLAVPVAMAVAVIGGLGPAWLAARTDPVTAVRPPVIAVQVRGVDYVAGGATVALGLGGLGSGPAGRYRGGGHRDRRLADRSRARARRHPAGTGVSGPGRGHSAGPRGLAWRISPMTMPRSRSKLPGCCNPRSNRACTNGAFSGRPDVVRYAVKPETNSASGGSDARSTSCLMPDTATRSRAAIRRANRSTNSSSSPSGTTRLT